MLSLKGNLKLFKEVVEMRGTKIISILSVVHILRIERVIQ